MNETIPNITQIYQCAFFALNVLVIIKFKNYRLKTKSTCRSKLIQNLRQKY